jgi:proteasome accessory factor C
MAKVTAAERVSRILATLPYIVAHQGVTLGELGERFGLTPDQLREDLNVVFFDVGLHPFTPDVMVDVFIDDDDRVTIHLGDYFRRPVRLSPEEGLTLLIAGRALLDRPGSDDPILASAVAKLSGVLGLRGSQAVEVTLGEADDTVLATVEAAVAEHRRLVIRYHSYGRDQTTEREVDPFRLFTEQGHWYLIGYCHRSEDQRMFRVDRIQTARMTEEVVEVPDEVDDDPFDLHDAARTIELIVPSEGGWVGSAYPVDEMEQLEDGRWRIVLPVTAVPWLERLLLRLGPDVEVTDAGTGTRLDSVGADAAGRVLARYGART